MLNKLNFFKDRPNMRLSFESFSYFFSEKILRIVVGFILQTWLARHLGPENMGIYSYVADFTAVFIPVVLFGLDDFVVRDLLREKDQGKVLGTIFGFRFFIAVVTWIVLVIAIWIVRGESKEIFILTSIYGTLIIFRSFDTFAGYFHSKFLIRPLTQGRQIVFIVASLIRAGGLLGGLGIIFFLANTWFQMVFERLISYIQLRRRNEITLSFDKNYLKGVIPHALPIALTGFFTFAETRLGTFFLSKFNSLEAVGSFGVGRGLLDLWEFVPVSIALTVFPIIVSSRDKDLSLYRDKLSKLYAGLFYMSLGFASALFFLASPVIHLLYGKDYDQTVPVLMSGAWMTIITYLNLARVKWYILEQETLTWLKICALTFALNVGFQFFFTSEYGIIGPYLSSISAHVLGNLVMCLFNGKVREDFKNIWRGIKLPLTYVLSR